MFASKFFDHIQKKIMGLSFTIICYAPLKPEC